jgi:hypothetical protein
MKPYLITPDNTPRYVPSPFELRQLHNVSGDAWRGLLYAGILVAIVAATAYCWWTA